jgi:hypothetical protein
MLLAMPAAADLSPPVWTNHSSVTTILEVSEPFPDYVIWRVTTYRTRGLGIDRTKNPSTLASLTYSAEEVSVEPGQSARITGDIARPYSIYAVPRSATDPGREPSEMIMTVNQGKVPGTARLSLDALESWDAPRDQSEFVVRYRLERTPDGIVFTRMTADGTSTFEGNSIGQRYRWMLAGAFAAVGAIAAGLWWARRAKKNTAAPIASPSDQP